MSTITKIKTTETGLEIAFETGRTEEISDDFFACLSQETKTASLPDRFIVREVGVFTYNFGFYETLDLAEKAANNQDNTRKALRSIKI